MYKRQIDIYDDRVELVSPGAMLDGTQIQDRDIYKVPSMRRNPVIADMFTQLDYMEKRGSGLRKMRELTEKLPNFLSGKEPQYQTEAISFYTTFYNLNWGENGRIPIEEVANRVNSSLEKYSIDEESSVKTFGDLQKSSVKTFGDLQNSSVKQKRLGRTAQSILDLVISDGSISQDKMAEKMCIRDRLGVTPLKIQRSFYGRKFPVEFQRVTRVTGIGISAQRRKKIGLHLFTILLQEYTLLGMDSQLQSQHAAHHHSSIHLNIVIKLEKHFLLGHTFLLFIHPVWIFYRKPCTRPE